LIRVLDEHDLSPIPKGGWETNVAVAFDDVFVTGNWFAAYSSNGGASWAAVSPYDMQKGIAGGFCCDQRILFIPQIYRFVWVLLSADADGENEITIAVSEPARLQGSKGRGWVRYHIRPGTVRQESQSFDYPDIAFGDSYLYLTANIGGRGLIARLPLGELARATPVNMQYYVVPQTWICPVQSTGAKGFFGAHTGTSTMRVWSWAEPPAAHITTSDLSIATIRTDDWLVNLPSGEQWFAPAQSPDNEVTGAARVRNELWFAWMEARRVPDHPEARAYPYPHINTAVVSATSLTLLRQERIWSSRRAYGWPALTANDRDVAITCMYGGEDVGGELCVGFLTEPRDLQLVSSGNRGGAGWHYIGVRPAYFSTTAFAALGYNRRIDPPTENISRPRYAVFERQ